MIMRQTHSIAGGGYLCSMERTAGGPELYGSTSVVRMEIVQTEVGFSLSLGEHKIHRKRNV